MTKFQAFREAHARWATPGIAPTDRVAWVKLRQKKVANRCEVGWYVRGGPGVPVESSRKAEARRGKRRSRMLTHARTNQGA